MNLRHLLSRKGLFYDVLLPVLRTLGPARADALLGLCGRLSGAIWLPWRWLLTRNLAHARKAAGAPWDEMRIRPRLAANVWRFLARDCMLDRLPDSRVAALFDVEEMCSLQAALSEGRGALLVGSHFGGHLAALHWLYRQGLPLRALVQRPNHISRRLRSQFDRDEPLPQAGFFLRRDLPPGQCVERLLRARAALRAGMAVYLNGDIPWTGPNTRLGRLLGQPLRFLSVWADLSVLTGAPVFLVFCTHLPGGRFGLKIESLGPIVRGEENAAVQRYLARLEAEIVARPDDAPAHILWPCFRPSNNIDTRSRSLAARPSRRVAVLPHS